MDDLDAFLLDGENKGSNRDFSEGANTSVGKNLAQNNNGPLQRFQTNPQENSTMARPGIVTSFIDDSNKMSASKMSASDISRNAALARDY